MSGRVEKSLTLCFDGQLYRQADGVIADSALSAALFGGLLAWAVLAHAAPPPDTAQAAYGARDFVSARGLWQARAASGDVNAQFGLGLLYDLGQGVASDAGQAYRWYLRAAEGGQPQAEFNVAVMNDSGRGTPHDAAVAALWYGRAASHGLWRAEYNLGQLYEAGDGVPQNLDEAATWYAAASAELPAAAEKWRKVASQPKREAAGLEHPGPPKLLSAVLLPLPVNNSSPASDELVWSAPKQAMAVRYYVTIMSLDGPAPGSLFAGFSDRSAMEVPELRGIRSFAWRVYTVATDVPHYAATPWQVETRPPHS